MSDTSVTIVGNLTGDPELRFLDSGVAVANFSVAVNRRVKDGDEWKDGEPSFFRCTVWRVMAENFLESCSKGDRVIVVGSLVQKSWEKDGEKRTNVEVEVQEVGPSCKWATAKPVKQTKGEAKQTASVGSDW